MIVTIWLLVIVHHSKSKFLSSYRYKMKPFVFMLLGELYMQYYVQVRFLQFVVELVISQEGNAQVSIDYHTVRIGQNCFSVGWNYANILAGQSCTMQTFQMEGFNPDQISASALSAPSFVLSSESGSFSLISSDITRDRLYYRVAVYDVNGQACDSTSSFDFYYFSSMLENGKFILVLQPLYSM